MTPGVHLSESSDTGDQRYVSPRVATMERGADLVIVGRGVTNSGDNDQVLQAMLNYKHQAWAALADKYLL